MPPCCTMQHAARTLFVTKPSWARRCGVSLSDRPFKCHCRGACFRMQTWVGQLFQPLAWLGGLYTMIQAALTDTLNLAALLKVSP